MRWPNVTKLSVTYLKAATGIRAVTRLPANLESHLPVYRVTRGPGSDDKITDSPLVDVETFAASEDAMWDAAEDARQAMHALAGTVVDGALVDTVSTATAPTYVDFGNTSTSDGNPAIFRAVASYRLALRKR